MKVLIAEDDLICQKILQHQLEALSLQPIVVPNGRKAYEIYRGETDIHLLIVNWMMPGMKGPTLCRKIRESAGKGRPRAYIILLTSKAQKEDIIEGIHAGADDFITKPLDRELFAVRLNAAKRIVEASLAHKTYSETIQLKLDKQLDNLKHAQRLQKNLNTVKIPSLKETYLTSFFMPSEGLSGDFFLRFKSIRTN